ncbi:glycosyltransferase family 39 protein [Paenibacillus sp. N1-5-1-14]|uniref:ArnT family glycosyltransferase n=1 Tax=Paenibacillus radicibacter TaxID=2972488 RepID=UPI00215968FD|nr:glycosyltransferase family 39 protein [Paenibacillus radicibacter]MCR8643145.1 glycosyltransferase family 39 protein [Paenibacillus radicibacter]
MSVTPSTYRDKGKYLIIIVLLLGLFLRLHYIANTEFEPVNWDQKNYTNMAIQIIEKGIYGYLREESNTLVTPGFPIFLVGVFSIFGYSDIQETHMIVRYIHAFMSIIYMWLIYRIGQELFNRPTGLLAALCAAVYGTYVWMASLILTETIFLTSFLALLYFQVRILKYNHFLDHIWGGILLGITVLIRPNAIIIAATPYIFLMIRHRRILFRQIIWGVSTFAVVMLPWWIRNIITFHELILVSKGGSANPFLGGTDPYLKGTIPWNNIKPEDEMAEGIRRVKEGFRTDPWLWIKWYTIGKINNMFIKTMYLGPYPSFVPYWYEKCLKGLHYALVYFGFAGGFLASFWNRNALFLYINFLLFLGVQLLFIPEARYTIGMMPFLMILCAYLAQLVCRGVVHLVRR